MFSDFSGPVLGLIIHHEDFYTLDGLGHVEPGAVVNQAAGEAAQVLAVAADPVVKYMSKAALEKAVKATEKRMYKAAEELDFTEAARLRDEMEVLKALLNENRLSKFK